MGILDTLPDGVQALELMNAYLFFLWVGMIVTFMLLLWEQRRRWYEPFYGAAVGLQVLILGEAGRQLWYWCWRYFANSSRAWLDWNTVHLVALFMLGALVTIGAACTIRNFTLRRYGHKAWILLLLFAAAGALASLLLPR